MKVADVGCVCTEEWILTVEEGCISCHFVKGIELEITTVIDKSLTGGFLCMCIIMERSR